MKFIAIILSLALYPIVAKSQLFSPPFVTAFQFVNKSNVEVRKPKIFSFTVVKSNLLAQLNWSTATEQNNKDFIIERSSDGIVFNEVAHVPSQAGGSNSAEKLNYIYFDDKPFSGLNYYRLKQTDGDGNELYSELAEADFGKDPITVYPNPAKDNITIGGLSGNENIQLYSQTGQLLKQQKATGPLVNFDISNIAVGVYRLSITNDAGKMITKKILKQ